ncbi:MAG: DUF58 domain-containing protein [Thermodesulfobacteriota bacterium]|nr:DUF58 domain-containing protein [Thermodesulfobacteriota bacterium]
MIPEELAKKIRSIQIRTSKTVNSVLAGEYESVFKGRGMEFDEVREYQPGDDIRTIDWNVTARTGLPYVKQYVEERELTVFFLVDLSASGAFGSITKTKNEVAAELTALLAFSAIKNNDKVGLIVFTDIIELFIPPKKGVSHVLRLIREILHFRPSQARTDISVALDFFGRIMRKRAVVFVISDFISPDFSQDMRILARRHDLISVSITDPREMELPPAGLIELEDAETGASILIDCGSREVREQYRQLAGERLRNLENLFRSMDVDHIPLQTGQDYVADLIRFFRTREKRMQYA